MAYLERIQAYLKEQGWEYRYSQEEGCGSIDFDYRGVPYHIWEFEDEEGQRGAEANLRHGGRQEEFFGDYERELIALMEEWKQK